MPGEFTDGQKSALKVINEEQNQYQNEQVKTNQSVNSQTRGIIASSTQFGNSKAKESRNSDISPEYRSVPSNSMHNLLLS